jgi:flagellar hook assembly protein FlgD
VPSGKTALEVRLHVYSQFIGTVYFDDLTVEKVGSATGVATNDGTVPKEFSLSNNYPNPFNPTTNIQFAIPREGNVTLAIYNMLGQRVSLLVQGVHSVGNYTVTWNGKDEFGHFVGSGVYFYRLENGSTAITKKMLMLK